MNKVRRIQHVACHRVVAALVAAVATYGLASTLLAQGTQTAAVRGLILDGQAAGVSNATITVRSPALQQPIVATSDAEGRYVVRALPPGSYTFTVERSGFSPRVVELVVPLGVDVESDVTLSVGGVVESVNVVAASPLSTPIVGANVTHEVVESLPLPRTIVGIAQLSPAVNENSPSRDQLVINGAFAFDNIFMINGVDINDNLRAQPQNLFIEDAIQETQVLTSGISAEYGRFTGGVVNAVTKSGGNKFSGSFRQNFFNPAWTSETPFDRRNNIEYPSDLQETYEGTLGGPILKDRLWFFTAGRYENATNPFTLPETGIPINQNVKNKRGEIKLTGTAAPGHTVQGGYLNNSLTTTNGSGAFSFIVDPHSLDVIPLPNWYAFTNYRGVLGGKVLGEAQYSERRWSTGGGGTSINLVDSPFVALSGPFIYNAPYFDANDQEERNNRQFTGSVTSFWEAAGRHEVKTGYEFFRSQRSGGGSQSSTSYVFNADYAIDANGQPLLDSTGHLIPVFAPGSSVDFFPATRGAVLNVDNQSFYVHDHWAINGRWSADLGARFEHVHAESTGGIVGVNSNRIAPRLAAAYDISGDGQQIAHVTYGMYSGRYNEEQIGKNSPVVNSPDLLIGYQGPAGQGRDFAPGFNLANYPITPQNSFVFTPPPSNVSNAGDLKSPVVHEFTASYGRNLWNGKGHAEATYVFRKTTSLIEDFQTVDGGFTDVTLEGIHAGLATNRIFKNTDLAHRQYQGLVFQTNYRVSNRWTATGHYTVQLRNHGNYEGETSLIPGATSLIGNFPEGFNERFYPDGRLQGFQRHRLRLWSAYDADLGSYGNVTVSGLWRVDSGRVYSLKTRVPLSATQEALLTAAGYPDFPLSNDVYFGERGSEDFKGFGLFDTTMNYNVPVFKSLRPWVKFDIFNLFDNDKQIAWNTTIRPDPNSPTDSLGIPTGYTPSATFGQATANFVQGINYFPPPFSGAVGGRTFRLSLGLRF